MNYLITKPDGSRAIWKGRIETDDKGQVWLSRNGQRIWFVPQEAIRLLDPVEALVCQSQGIPTI